ncbi:hypothetical protein LTR91_007186 [Friedmanniomyces endolithicus]|uniref:Acyl-CoA dehydrogenase/oxidase C-terminal domain-containing protein n=1 Tax=Friedmanniomyces endolithicus TaxID=329885 RepID=A0AAN6QVD1_9PEZI|nr:hypothetical protein LTR57_018676 [Friedmanniomyces endolithicus]KAK0967466.1 hypothetical protein LTS01_017241 [Friedmanniomyces endolithicus]KAK0995766.1 hypothetical protein LTR91_007186 [Friedmanniomyces endolithicus]KAK1037977.1 hypothetical protein LTS16_012429 [Friedmanniomyces endolithicus]
MGYDHAPEGHGEYLYTNARIPAANIILGPGRAFEIAQGRLGPGRIHHCMRLIGQTERAYELALIRATDPSKKPRGRLIGDFDSNIERLAAMRLQLDSMRLVVLMRRTPWTCGGTKRDDVWGAGVDAAYAVAGDVDVCAVCEDCGWAGCGA